jgi:hypothetical protein
MSNEHLQPAIFRGGIVSRQVSETAVETRPVWPGFDPEVLRDLQTIRQLVKLTHQTPDREWPLLLVEQEDALFVIREWPDGSLTAYTTSAATGSRR